MEIVMNFYFFRKSFIILILVAVGSGYISDDSESSGNDDYDDVDEESGSGTQINPPMIYPPLLFPSGSDFPPLVGNGGDKFFINTITQAITELENTRFGGDRGRGTVIFVEPVITSTAPATTTSENMGTTSDIFFEEESTVTETLPDYDMTTEAQEVIIRFDVEEQIEEVVEEPFLSETVQIIIACSVSFLFLAVIAIAVFLLWKNQYKKYSVNENGDV
jgi:hypothetical protein